jgi:hypothetical protein
MMMLSDWRKLMTLQAYLDNIQTQTGKTPKDFLELAEKKGYLKQGVKTGEIVSWLKNDFGLGHGHAMAIVLTMQNATRPHVSKDERLAKLFAGNKARWQKPYDDLLLKIKQFGADISVVPTNSYISLLRANKKFGIVQVNADHFDVGIKLKGEQTNGRLAAAGDWNRMVTHRVRISDPKQIDRELLAWLKKAYTSANPAGMKSAEN